MPAADQVLPAALLAADCPAYLSSEGTGLPACDMTKRDYLAGHWELLPERCRPGSLDDLGSLAYPYKQDCSSPLIVCEPNNPQKAYVCCCCVLPCTVG